MERQLKFSCLSDSSNGILSPDDLFFFYCLGLDHFIGIPAIYEDTNDVKKLVKTRNLTIDGVEKEKMPTSFEEGKIFFVIEKCDKTKYDALYRHLRNAFAHFHINRSGNYYILNDYYDDAGTKMTMIGKIACEDLKDLTEIFYAQREKEEKE